MAGAGASAAADRAKKLYEDGAKAAGLNQWERARAVFAEAWRLKQHWQIAVNLGQAELKTGKYRDAAEHLAYFLREGQAAGAADRKKGEAMLAEARKHVGELAVTVNRAQAEILVDDQVVGRAPLGNTLFVDPGQHVVVARLDGYTSIRESQQVYAGTTAQFDFQLTEIVELKPALPAPVAKVDIKPSAAGDNRRWWIAGGGSSIAVAAAAFGITYTLKANAASENATKKLANLQTNLRGQAGSVCGKRAPTIAAQSCSEIKNSLVSQDRFTTIAVTSLLAASASAAGTLALVMATRPAPRSLESGLRVVPVVDTTYGGALLAVSF